MLRLIVSAIVVVLLLGAGAAILGAADLRKANAEIRQVLATSTAYRHLGRALAFESPAQWTEWATSPSGPTGTPTAVNALFATTERRELRPPAVDSGTRAESQAIAAMHDRYARVANRYLALMAVGDTAGAETLWQRQLTPLYLALSSRLSADADQEPSLVRWHLGRVAQVSEVMWVGTGGVLAVVMTLLGILLFVIVRQRRWVTLAHAEHLLRSADVQIDAASGLYAERPFRLELQREVARGLRGGTTVALALIDIDQLQDNAPDIQAREADALVREFAGFLSGRRVEDRTFRLNSGQFALILPGANAREVYPLMEHLHTAAEAAMHHSPLSIGVADLATSGTDTADLLVHRAEAALGEAHRQGGNTVVAFAVKPRRLMSSA